MFRIGILGTENSHAAAFSEIFNGNNPKYNGEFDDIKVVAVGGNYYESSKELYDKYNLEFIAEKPEDMLGKVDAVMVTARDGKYHAPFARPFIEAGIPAFIDKPFTSDPDEAIELIRLAKSKNVPLVGGSSVKLCPDTLALQKYVKEHAGEVCGGSASAPLSMVNEYGGFFFYSSHLAEISMTIFGYDPEWVIATENNNSVTAIAHYADYDVTNHFTEKSYLYSGTAFTPSETHFSPISLEDAYVYEARSFANMLRNGEMDHTYEQLAMPVLYLKAIEKSYLTGTKQFVGKIEL